MSFFDPYHISEYTGYYSKKGQVIQKRHVDRNPALSLKDKERAIKILNSFGYKAVPNDYMPIERYSYFAGRTLVYPEIGEISSGSSFQIKLKNLLSFLPDLPIMTQISYNNVEEFNIDCILTSYSGSSNADSSLTVARVIFGEGTFQFITNVTQYANNSCKFAIQPSTDYGFIFKGERSGSTSTFNSYIAQNARKGQLTENLITGDKFLFHQVVRRDFSDPRFDVNVVDFQNSSSNPDDIINLIELGVCFSVYVEVVYKTYLD